MIYEKPWWVSKNSESKNSIISSIVLYVRKAYYVRFALSQDKISQGPASYIRVNFDSKSNLGP